MVSSTASEQTVVPSFGIDASLVMIFTLLIRMKYKSLHWTGYKSDWYSRIEAGST